MARRLWADLAPFINMAQAKLLPLGQGSMDLHQTTRSDLQELMDGRLRLEGKWAAAVPLSLGGDGGRITWGLRHVDPRWAPSAERLKYLRDHWKFVIFLLALPEVRPYLKQCATCGAFWMARAVRPKRKSNTRRDFCSPACAEKGDTPEDKRLRHRDWSARNLGRRARA
jgi:hypothetical protein